MSFTWKNVSTLYWAYFIRLAEGMLRKYFAVPNLSSCYLPSAYHRGLKHFILYYLENGNLKTA